MKKLLVYITIAILACSSTYEAKAVKKVTRKCAPYIFFGMRGSGQNIENGPLILKDFGPEIASLYTSLSIRPKFKGKIEWAKLKSQNANSQYLAQDVTLSKEFIDSITIGATKALSSQFNLYLKKCEKDTKFIFAGYSQGAYATHWLINELEKNNKGVLKRIVGVILLADPGKPKEGMFDLAWSIKYDAKYKLLYDTLMKCPDMKSLNNQAVDFCITTMSVLNYAATSETKLLEPKIVPVYNFDHDGDLVSDTTNWLNSAVEKLLANFILTGLNGLAEWINEGASIHGSYCPTTGPYISFFNTGKCRAQNYSEFISSSIGFLERNI